jgi:hypothetical protein
MPRGRVGRDEIVRAIVNALEPMKCVHALWEGGAAGWGALDEWSDIDLCADADDARAPDVLKTAERALESLSGIEIEYPVPFPPTHNYAQAFYRVKGASPFLLVDLAVFKHSASDKFLVPEIHGRPIFLFNKGNALEPPEFDVCAHVGRMRDRLKRLRARHDMFWCFFEKEMGRGNTIEAVHHYQRILLDTLLEVLRMRHGPLHFDFGFRYVHRELPAPVLRRLERLTFVKDERELRTKARRAEQWLRETMDAIDFDDIERSLGTRA